ncbi:MAG: diguanylate cyclase [Planctomycetota bacterium]
MSAFDELEIADRLPSPPGLCLTLLGLSDDRREARRMMVECLRADPALTGRLVRRVNATRAEGTAPVATAREAAAKLDSAAIREVALGFSLASKKQEEFCEAFDLRRHWLLSLACAAAAEAIARRFESMDPDEAFTLGLLCRVGMLALATIHPAEYAAILRECESAGPGALEGAELRVLQIDHWRAGADLMEAWGFPASFVTPMIAASRSAQGFSPADSGATSSHAMLTLALRIAEEIVAEHGGAAPGTTSVVSTELKSARIEAGQRFGQLVDLSGLRAHVDAPAEAPHPVAAAPTSSPEPAAKNVEAPPVTRILVVDDDPGARHLLGAHLRRAGYEVISAADGKEGLRTAILESPQMVITDWLMPGMSGLELCKALRETEIGRHTYLIVLTSREEDDSVVAGLEAGANDYVTKPFNPRILLARVQAGDRIIELRRQVEIDKLIDRKRVAQVTQLNRRLRTVAFEDMLTGLRNRRFAMEELQRAWTASARTGRKVSVVMIDIDHFKRVNDEHGHQTGDEVLRATANVLRDSCRRSDTVCRFGGEEFLVITTNGTPNEAMGCAERLRSAVEAKRIQFGTFDRNVTISLGVAERSEEMQSIDDLIAAADRAVYQAKAQGRNRACLDSRPREMRESA